MAASSSSAAACAAALPSWPAGGIQQKKDGTIAVEWSDTGLTDEALEAFAIHRLDDLLAGMPAKGAALECVVDLSNNSLQRPGPLASLVRRLRASSVHVTVLRLHGNQLVDEVCAVLAEHMHEAANLELPLMQLHLSGNALTARGVRVLIEGAHRCGAYPLKKNAGRLKSLGADVDRRALWLRVERQRPEIEDGGAVVEQCRTNGFPVAMVPKGQTVPEDAVVQLHFAFVGFTQDREGGGKGKGKEKGKDKGKGNAQEKGKGKGKYMGEDLPEFQRREQGKGKDASGEKGHCMPCEKGKGKADDGKGKGKGKGKGDDGKGKGKGPEVTQAKTVLCTFFEQGICQKGEFCTFAHGTKELQKRDAHAPALNNASASQEGARYKMDLCKYHERGHCENGARCTFAHGAAELRRKGAPSGPQAEAPAAKGDAVGDAMQWLKVNRERPGQEGERFEQAWKAWCKQKDLNSMEKSERVQNIVAFKEFWSLALAAAGAVSQSGSAPIASSTTAAAPSGPKSLPSKGPQKAKEGKPAATPAASAAPAATASVAPSGGAKLVNGVITRPKADACSAEASSCAAAAPADDRGPAASCAAGADSGRRLGSGSNGPANAAAAAWHARKKVSPTGTDGFDGFSDEDDETEEQVTMRLLGMKNTLKR